MIVFNLFFFSDLKHDKDFNDFYNNRDPSTLKEKPGKGGPPPIISTTRPPWRPPPAPATWHQGNSNNVGFTGSTGTPEYIIDSKLIAVTATALICHFAWVNHMKFVRYGCPYITRIWESLTNPVTCRQFWNVSFCWSGRSAKIAENIGAASFWYFREICQNCWKHWSNRLSTIPGRSAEIDGNIRMAVFGQSWHFLWSSEITKNAENTLFQAFHVLLELPKMLNVDYMISGFSTVCQNCHKIIWMIIQSQLFR